VDETEGSVGLVTVSETVVAVDVVGHEHVGQPSVPYVVIAFRHAHLINGHTLTLDIAAEVADTVGVIGVVGLVGMEGQTPHVKQPSLP